MVQRLKTALADTGLLKKGRAEMRHDVMYNNYLISDPVEDRI